MPGTVLFFPKYAIQLESVFHIICVVYIICAKISSLASNTANSTVLYFPRARILLATDRLGALLELGDNETYRRIVSGGSGLEVWDIGEQAHGEKTVIGLKVSTKLYSSRLMKLTLSRFVCFVWLVS